MTEQEARDIYLGQPLGPAPLRHAPGSLLQACFERAWRQDAEFRRHDALAHTAMAGEAATRRREGGD
jgi:hypothetical protein